MKGERAFAFSAAIACIALTVLKTPVTDSTHVLFLTKAFLRDTSLSRDYMVGLLTSSAYGLPMVAIAHVLAWVCSVGIPPEIPFGCVQVLLWAAQAFLMFTLARKMTLNREAAFLATLFYGLHMQVFMYDAPSGTIALERGLGMLPLLWGIGELLEGRRWRALAGVTLSTYLHATPAVYLFPWLVVEDLLIAIGDPAGRRQALLRAACVPLLLLPVSGVAWHPADQAALDPAFKRMVLLLELKATAGLDYVPADYLYSLEGFVLLGLAFYRLRRLPAMPLLLRYAGVCLGLMLLGTVSYFRAQKSTFFLWWTIAKVSPWNCLANVQLLGQPVLAAMLTGDLAENAASVPAFWLLFPLLILGGNGHDFILLLLAVGLTACHINGWKRQAKGLILAAGLLPLLYSLFPGAFHRAGQAVGLHGGVFGLAAFHASTGLGMLACLALGLVLERLPRGGLPRARAATVAAACVMILAMSGVWLRARGSPAQSERTTASSMAEWIRDNTPADSVILWSPIDSLYDPSLFRAKSERALFCDFGCAMNSPKYGRRATVMADRLQALGIDVTRLAGAGHVLERNLHEEMQRAGRELTPGLAEKLEARYGVTYLVLDERKPWPVPPVHREDGLALYPARPSRSMSGLMIR